MKIFSLLLFSCGLFAVQACKSNDDLVGSDVLDGEVRKISFTETMRGYYTSDRQMVKMFKNNKKNDKTMQLEDETFLALYKRAYTKGKQEFEDKDNAGSNENMKHGFMFNLTVNVDIDKLENDVGRPGTMSPFGKDALGKDAGYLEIPSLSNKRMKVISGVFGLLADDGKRTKKMRYLLNLRDDSNNNYTFYGFKKVRRNSKFVNPMEIWKDTSTLYISLFKSDKNEKFIKISDFKPKKSQLLGIGMLHILPADFVRQMTTSRGDGSFLNAIVSLGLFGKFFARKIIETYITDNFKFKWDVEEAPQQSGYSRSTQRGISRVEAEGVRYVLKTTDGLGLGIMRYKRAEVDLDRPPIMLIAGLGVNNLIFTQNDTQRNLAEYLASKNYDVWVIEARFNTDFKNYSKYGRWDGDDTFKDYEAAIDLITRETNKSQIDVFAHCYGAHTILSSIMNGFTSETNGKIRRLMLSQATLYADVLSAKEKQIEILGNSLDKLRKVGIGYLSTNPEDDQMTILSGTANLFAKIFSHLASDSSEEDGSRGLLRNQAKVANDRIRFIYGDLHELKNLTAEALSNDGFPLYYGAAGIGHLLTIQRHVKSKMLVTRLGTGLTSEDDLVKKISMPVGIIHGELNKTWLPSGSNKTIARLDEMVPNVLHELYLIPEYGHLDTIYGKDAIKDVYPIVHKFFAAKE